MGDAEGTAMTADITSGDMIFQPILEDGVFRFDCSTTDRDKAYPSISFIDGKVRETPIVCHKVPSITPTYHCLLGQQNVTLEVSY